MAVSTKQTSAGGVRSSRRGLVGWGTFGVVAAGLLALGIATGQCDQHLASWVRLTITGTTLGALYAMIALGYTMVYGVLQLLNFAHSEVFMIGTFAGFWVLHDLFNLNASNHPHGLGGVTLLFVFLVAIALAALASGITAVIMERLAYRPLRRAGASRLGYLITAIGVSLFLSNLFLLLDGHQHLNFKLPLIHVHLLPFNWPHIAGREPIPYPLLMQRTNVFHIAGVPVQNIQLLVIGVTIAMLLILDYFVYRTQAGKGIRAVAEDPETASLMGVNINRIVVITFLLGGMMAGAAGLLYGINFGETQFNIGFLPGIKAFTAAVLGGIGNVRGAMLGGLLLGLIENLSVACIGIQWQPVIAFTVLVGVLMFRPTGLLGEQVGG